MLILCCWLCAAISWKYSSLELRISATISFVISTARLSTFWMLVVFNAFSKVLGNMKLYFLKLIFKNVKGTVSGTAASLTQRCPGQIWVTGTTHHFYLQTVLIFTHLLHYMEINHYSSLKRAEKVTYMYVRKILHFLYERVIEGVTMTFNSCFAPWLSIRAVPDSGQCHSELSWTAASLTERYPGQCPACTQRCPGQLWGT